MNDIDVKKNIATNITKYRKDINMSQKELANRLGVVPSRVSNWETGTNMMDIDALFKICDILSVSINDIYGIYPDSKIQLSFNEQNHIKKYRDLDSHGTEIVDMVLENEHKRWKAEQEKEIKEKNKIVPLKEEMPVHLMPIAAHNDFANDDEEQRLMQEDIDDL